MSEGRLETPGVSIAGTLVTIYTVPSTASSATVRINLCNTGTTSTKVRVAFSLTATPGLAEYQVYDSVIPANGGVLTDTCRLLSTGERVVLYADSSTVSYRVEGVEQPI